jgi:hypothetical protein
VKPEPLHRLKDQLQVQVEVQPQRKGTVQSAVHMACLLCLLLLLPALVLQLQAQ